MKLLLFRIKLPDDSSRVKTSMSGPVRGNSGCRPKVVQRGDVRPLVAERNDKVLAEVVGAAADHDTV